MKISPIDVKGLLVELQQAGVSDATVGRAVGAPRATINRLRHGKHQSTSVNRAIQIANFHQQHFRTKERVAA